MKAASHPSAPTQVLICRNYRGDVDMSEVEHFMPILMEKEEEGMLSPILAHGGVRFMWIKHNNLYRIPGELPGDSFVGMCMGTHTCNQELPAPALAWPRAALGTAGPRGPALPSLSSLLPEEMGGEPMMTRVAGVRRERGVTGTASGLGIH